MQILGKATSRLCWLQVPSWDPFRHHPHPWYFGDSHWMVHITIHYPSKRQDRILAPFLVGFYLSTFQEGSPSIGIHMFCRASCTSHGPQAKPRPFSGPAHAHVHHPHPHGLQPRMQNFSKTIIFGLQTRHWNIKRKELVIVPSAKKGGFARTIRSHQYHGRCGRKDRRAGQKDA